MHIPPVRDSGSVWADMLTVFGIKLLHINTQNSV